MDEDLRRLERAADDPEAQVELERARQRLTGEGREVFEACTWTSPRTAPLWVEGLDGRATQRLARTGEPAAIPPHFAWWLELSVHAPDELRSWIRDLRAQPPFGLHLNLSRDATAWVAGTYQAAEERAVVGETAALPLRWLGITQFSWALSDLSWVESMGLRELRVNGLPGGKEELRWPEALPTLEHLRMDARSGVPIHVELPALRRLDLYLPERGSQALVSILGGCPRLRSLRLHLRDRSRRFDEPSVVAALASARTLEALELWGVPPRSQEEWGGVGRTLVAALAELPLRVFRAGGASGECGPEALDLLPTTLRELRVRDVVDSFAHEFGREDLRRLARFPELERLSLADLRLTTSDCLEVLACLPRLEALRLDGAIFPEDEELSFQGLPPLAELSFLPNSLPTAPPSLRPLAAQRASLRRLSVSGSSVPGPGALLAEVADFQRLEALCLKELESPTGWERLAALPRLRRLVLVQCRPTSAALAGLAGAPRLTELVVQDSFTRLPPGALEALSRSPLRSLHVSGGSAEGNGLCAAFARLRSLEDLWLDLLLDEPDEALLELLALPALRELHVVLPSFRVEDLPAVEELLRPLAERCCLTLTTRD
ncbi:MAG: hypothetical protein AB7N76_35960 [Planctomycetota bacterium]